MIKHATIQGHPVKLDRNVLTVHHPDTEDLRSKTWTLTQRDLHPIDGIISLLAGHRISTEVQNAWGTLISVDLDVALTDSKSKVLFIKGLREQFGRVETPKPFTITFNTEEDYSFAVQLLVNAGLEGWK